MDTPSLLMTLNFDSCSAWETWVVHIFRGYFVIYQAHFRTIISQVEHIASKRYTLGKTFREKILYFHLLTLILV